MTRIAKVPNLWCFYGFYFSEGIRKIIEQKLIELETKEIDNGNWPFKGSRLRDEENKLIFVFELRDGNTRQVEFEIEEKIFFFRTILSFPDKIDYHGIGVTFISRGIYFLKSEKELLQKYLSGLQKALESI